MRRPELRGAGAERLQLQRHELQLQLVRLQDTSTTHGAFSRVSGAWTTPKVVCTAEDTITSEWVGIDGANSTTVEQDGTIGWCFEGKPTYFTWYEMYPAGTIEVGKTLQPGDKITAVVARTGTTYKLTVVDSTRTGDNVSKTATCAATTCVDTSDEWIAERSSFSIGIAPLADYGTWTLSSGAGIKGGQVLDDRGDGKLADGDGRCHRQLPAGLHHGPDLGRHVHHQVAEQLLTLV